MADARQKRADQLEEVEKAGELARLNPDDEVMDFFEGLCRALRPMLREAEKHPKDLSRNLIDGVRELRQAAREVREILDRRGNAAGPEKVISDLEARLAEANLGDGLAPYLEHPA